MINVAAYTGGVNIPSARYRVRELIPVMLENGFKIKEFPSPLSSYAPSFKPIRPFWAAASLASRIPSVIAGYRSDISFFQREMLSTLVTLEPFTNKPRVLDVDDAIYLSREGKAAKRLAQLSNLVICGNDYLADYFSQWNSNIEVIPTAVDTSHYLPANSKSSDRKVIGWMGTSSNFKYLYKISSALEKVIQNRSDVNVRIISDKRPVFNNKLDESLEYTPWRADQEVTQLQNMTVGIMPLADGEWERGKCSFKMLLYMACGLPVVVSSVGMNQEVLSKGGLGFGVRSDDEWLEVLNLLLDDADLSERMGRVGRKVVEEHYSHKIIADQLAKSLSQVI